MDPTITNAAPKESVHKRIIHKIKGDAEADEEASRGELYEHHRRTEAAAAAIVHAVIRQGLKEMVTSENMAVLTELVMQQSANVARQAVTDVGRHGTRISAQEAFTGSYDAVERKWLEWYQSMPKETVLFVLAAAGTYVGLLALGLLLAIWRFAAMGV